MGIKIHCVIPASSGEFVAKCMVEGNVIHALAPTLRRIKGVELLLTKGASVDSRWSYRAEVSEAVHDPFFTVSKYLQAFELVERAFYCPNSVVC